MIQVFGCRAVELARYLSGGRPLGCYRTTTHTSLRSSRGILHRPRRQHPVRN